MFPLLQLRVDTAWFLDFDTRAWVDPTGEAKADQEMSNALEADGDKLRQLTGEDHGPMTLEQAIAPEPILSLPDSHPFRRRM